MGYSQTEVPQHQQQIPTLPQLLASVQEAAKALSMSSVSIYQLAHRGELRLVKFGPRCTRIPVEDIQRLAKTGAAVMEQPEVAA